MCDFESVQRDQEDLSAQKYNYDIDYVLNLHKNE